MNIHDIIQDGLIAGMTMFIAWFAGRMFEKVHRNRRDIDAIAMILREVEVSTQTRLEAMDFTVKTILAEKTGSENTAFNLADLRDRDKSKEK